MEKTLLHERFERFVQSAFERTPDIFVNGKPLLDYLPQIIGRFDEIYQESVGHRGVRYEPIAIGAMGDFEDWIIGSFNLETDTIIKIRRFCQSISNELELELSAELKKSRERGELGAEGKMISFKKNGS